MDVTFTRFVRFLSGIILLVSGAAFGHAASVTSNLGTTANMPELNLANTRATSVGADTFGSFAATKYVIISITPSTPTAGAAFKITVQSQNASGVPTNVGQDTFFGLITNGVAGDMAGTQTGQIDSGQNTVIIEDVVLPNPGTGVTISTFHVFGDSLEDGTSAPFAVGAAASQLAFVGFPSGGSVGTTVPQFTVEARRPDNTLDATYTGTVTLSQASGPGNVSGTTLTATASAGIATFGPSQGVKFDTAGTYTLYANSGGLTQATSSTIAVTLAPVALGNYPFAGTATTAGPASRMVATGTAANMTLGSVGRSGLSVLASSGADNDVLSLSPSTGNYGAAINTGLFIEFTATPFTGHYIGLSSLTFSSVRVATGATNFAVRSSLDNYATNIATGSTGTSIATSNISLSANATSAITFRIYPYGGGGTGAWRIDNIVLNGNVLCIQPSTFNVTGGGARCTSGGTVAIALSGSQVGISYNLKRNGTTIDSPIAGTGNAISFLGQSVAGTYTVEAFNPTAACGSATLMMIGNATVTVNPAPVAGSISGGGVTVCSGTNSTSLTLSGHTGAIQWQSSSDNNTFNSISGATSTTYNVANLTAMTYYRAQLSSGVCTPATTASVVVNVSQPAVTGNITPATTAVCSGTNSTLLTLAGNIGTVQWQYSADGTNFTNIGGASGQTFTATNLVATTYYRALVSNGACAPVQTANVVINVGPVSVAGSISGAASVCSGTNNTILTLSGHTGTIQWQSSSDNNNFNDIPGATAAAFAATNLTATTYYRALVTSSPCSSATAASVAVTVNPTSVAGTISGGNVTVCAAGNETVLTLSGNTGNIQWQSSTNNSTFTDISGATGTTYTATNLTATTYYRAVSTSTPCASATSASVSIMVNPAPVAGTISGGGVTVCPGSNNIQLNLSGNSGNVQWQSSSDGNTFVDIDGENGPTYTPVNLTASRWYRVTVSNAPCSSVMSDAVSVTVGPEADAGTVSGGGAFCSGTSATLTVSGSNGTIKWQSSSDNSNFTDVSGETNITFDAPIAGTMYYRVQVNTNGCTAVSPSVSVGGGTTTTWNGTSWSNGSPDGATAVIFAGNYTASEDLSACSIVVQSGNVVIPSGFDVNLTGGITVNGGSFILENSANLLQATDAVNTGNIIVKRNSAAIRRQDYTLWSSPVAGQTLLSFSPMTVTSPTSRFYQYNSLTNAYNSIVAPGSVNFNAAQGYLIRVANNHPTWPTVWNGQFNGVPHNGNYSYNLYNGGEGLRFSCVGNPYPSPISMTAFVAANAAQITQTLYFWRETNGSAANNAYCSWSPAGGPNGTFVSNGNAAAEDPQGVIQTGQGFLVEASETGTQLSFTNAMRVGNNANQFFRPASAASSPGDSESHRIWLNVTNGAGAFSQTAFGYMTGASNSYDTGIDGKYINSGDVALYSFADGQKLVIQGRALPFASTDIVPVGFRAATAGAYAISIDHVDGLFGAGQQIYIKDNQTGTHHLLNGGPYSFTTDAGEFASRFEIWYQGALGLDNPTLESNLAIVKDGDVFSVDSGDAVIESIVVFDIRGRKLIALDNVDASRTQFGVPGASQILIVKIKSQDGQQVTRKVVN